MCPYDIVSECYMTVCIQAALSLVEVLCDYIFFVYRNIAKIQIHSFHDSSLIHVSFY